MTYDSGNNYSSTAVYNFPGLSYPSTVSELGQDQIFRKIVRALSASEVQWLCDTVRQSTPESIVHLIEKYCQGCKEKESLAKQDRS
jgi:hypothetical protein